MFAKNFNDKISMTNQISNPDDLIGILDLELDLALNLGYLSFYSRSISLR